MFLKASAFSASVPVALTGSGMPQWAVIGWPGQGGHSSFAAASQSVNTKSSGGASAPWNSPTFFARSTETSCPLFSSTSSANGFISE